jgi:hypothetical protein
LLGHYKNYDELESNLSLEELMATINASREKEKREREFFAAINGISLEGAADTKVEADIAKNVGYIAREEGFGINEGLGHFQMEEE